MHPPAFVVMHFIAFDQISRTGNIQAMIEVGAAVVVYVVVDKFAVVAAKEATLFAKFDFVAGKADMVCARKLCLDGFIADVGDVEDKAVDDDVVSLASESKDSTRCTAKTTRSRPDRYSLAWIGRERDRSAPRGSWGNIIG